MTPTEIQNLSGDELRRMVAVCLGFTTSTKEGVRVYRDCTGRTVCSVSHWRPDIDWSQGGSLIEKHNITVTKDDGVYYASCEAEPDITLCSNEKYLPPPR